MDFAEFTFLKIFEVLLSTVVVFGRRFLAGRFCPHYLRSNRVATILGLEVCHRVGNLLGQIFTPSVISLERRIGSWYRVLLNQGKRRAFEALNLRLGWLWRLVGFRCEIVRRFLFFKIQSSYDVLEVAYETHIFGGELLI